MVRFITPIILIGVAIAAFFVITNPLYEDVKALHAKASSYDEALNNSKALENERDKLTAKYNSISTDNLSRIKKLLPDSIDNIRLILEIGQIASPYNMVLKNVKYNSSDEATTPDAGVLAGGNVPVNKDYGSWNLEFSTSGTYNDFINFLGDLESNLRIVDISSISFSSDVGTKANPNLPDIYTYNFKITTYWLKN
jgi:hypothetical protein